MKSCPETPTLDETVAFSGHIWVQERPTGGAVRFQVAPSGFVTFATGEQSFDTVAAVPMQYRRAARLVEERLDRDALHAATEDPGEVTFCGVATRNEGVEYDWDAMPAFVGVDVWSERNGQFLSPDTATSVFDRLGLPTLPAIEKEQPAAHARLDRFADGSSFPPSAWRDGPAVGVLLRDKAGGRAEAWASDRPAAASTPAAESATALAAAYATPERIAATADAVAADGDPLTVETIRTRLLADVAREAYVDLFSADSFVASVDSFRSAVGERIQRHRADE